jgi:hypothetical protein
MTRFEDDGFILYSNGDIREDWFNRQSALDWYQTYVAPGVPFDQWPVDTETLQQDIRDSDLIVSPTCLRALALAVSTAILARRQNAT